MAELELERLKTLPLELVQEVAALCPPELVTAVFTSILPKRLSNAYKLFYLLFRNGRSALLRDSVLIGADLHRLMDSDDMATEPETWLALFIPNKDIGPSHLQKHLRPHIVHTHHRVSYLELSFLENNIRLFVSVAANRHIQPLFVPHPERLFQKQGDDYQTALLQYECNMRVKNTNRFLRILSEDKRPASIGQYVTIYLDDHDPENLVHISQCLTVGLVESVQNDDGEVIGYKYCDDFERKQQEKLQDLQLRQRSLEFNPRDCEACLHKGISPIPDVWW